MRQTQLTILLLLSTITAFCQSRTEIQSLLNKGTEPKALIEQGIHTDSLLGLTYGGGLIFLYDSTTFKGYVVSTEDLHYRNDKSDIEISWSCIGKNTGATGTKVGTGKLNTEKILNARCPLYEPEKGWLLPAAELCTLYRGSGFSDWFLPSKDELAAVYLNLKEPGHHDFHNHMYWTSSEKNDGFAWIMYFINGGQGYYIKYMRYYVRAIREI